MKNLLIRLTVIAVFAACNAIEKKAEFTVDTHQSLLSEKQKAEGWELLYDGKSTKGWHIYLNGSDGSAWKSENGELYLDAAEENGWQTKGGGDLVSDSTYEDFHLCLEWKISEKGNSGILFYVQEDPKYEYSWYTGPEMQILDNLGRVEGIQTTQRAGDLMGLFGSTKDHVNYPGRWNTADIRVEKGKIDIFMNGERVLSASMNDELWKRTIANSEFGAIAPDLGKFHQGHIALQDHGDPVWFRNIRIRRL